jgi:heme exporter protein CcmD
MSEAHWSYIVVAYAVTIASVGAIALRIVLEHRRLCAELARLEAAGADESESP